MAAGVGTGRRRKKSGLPLRETKRPILIDAAGSVKTDAGLPAALPQKPRIFIPTEGISVDPRRRARRGVSRFTSEHARTSVRGCHEILYHNHTPSRERMLTLESFAASEAIRYANCS
jgi:hypothetical protein